MAMQTFLTTLSASLVATQHHIIPLSERSWTLSNQAFNISVPASLPSHAHLDLYNAGIIEHPLLDLNEFEQRWIAFSNWTYTSEPLPLLKNTSEKTGVSTWLRFDGLDTFTTIYFCNKVVATTDNQFRQYLFNVTDLVSACPEKDLRLVLEFGSAPIIANVTAVSPDQEQFPEGIQFVYEFDNAYYIRKEQSDFGWDWGPAFAPAGPWQPAYVVQLGRKAVHVHNSDIDIYREGQLPLIPPDQSKNWVVNASLDIVGVLPGNAHLAYTLVDCQDHIVSQGQMTHLNRTSQAITGLTTVERSDVELWWPNGLGDQTLYHVTVSIQVGDTILASVTKRVGFRTIVLNMFPIDEEQLTKGIAPGNNWKFEINGHEFYAKGSNFIPPDPFWPNVTVERMTQLFDSAVEGNQNMLRVWSSGAYSPDFIYDLADERGLLLWSEFEFSDHLYPVTESFLDNVREEAIYNVRRVNHHPSLALWAGGNELESLILLGIVKGKVPKEFDRFMGEFEKLFIDVLSPAVFSNSRSISYTPSSTGNGWLTLNYSTDPLRPFTERYLNKTDGSIYGDTDYYNYNPDILGAFDRYPVGRFSNEFGFLSLPSVQSWSQQVSQDQLFFRSPVTTLRCHHDVAGGLNTSNFDASNNGYNQMVSAVEAWYPTPHKDERMANFTAWVYATQVYQADLMKSQIEFYRRGSGMPERQLGSLYWQLEDQWVAPTWASIEYDGRWKMLHYVAKDIYEPVIIAPYYNRSSGLLTVYVTSSLWEQVQGSATFDWYDWAGNQLDIGPTKNTDFVVGGLNTTMVLSINITQALGNHNQSNAVLRMTACAKGNLPNSADLQLFEHENWFHAAPLRDAMLIDPELALTFDKCSDSFTVTAHGGIAAWVFLDYPLGVVLSFDSNGFWLLPGESKQIGYTIKSEVSNDNWRAGVTARSMWDLTHARWKCISSSL